MSARARRFAAAALAALTLGCSRSAPAPVPATLPAEPPCVTWWRTGDPAIDGLLPLIRDTLAVDERELNGRTGRVAGFGAGATYPQIWIRDSATLVPIVRWLYPRERAASWLLEHLSHQRGDSSLYDWIAAGPAQEFRADAPQAAEIWRSGPDVLTADRNTNEVDQEASAVLAAWELFELYGPIWLDSAVAGRPLLDRLDASLLSVVEGRRDTTTGLVISGLTADWGDVAPVHGDQTAIYLDDATPRVGSLYANAMALMAAQRMRDLARAGARPLRAKAWEGTAARMRIDLRHALFDAGRGYFLVNRPLRGPEPPQRIDFGAMLALGGNAVAAQAGAFDEPELARLFDEIERRHREQGASVLGLTLMPPFPTGFFKHPILREAGTYQNGGHWDWFAGRLALAMLAGGDARRGGAQLRALAGRAVARKALHEWHTAQGEGRGSPHYAGSAGALGTAVFEGLLGLDWTRDPARPSATLAVLSPRLGRGRTRMQACSPGTTARLEYDYEMTADGLRLRYKSTADGARVEVLLPADRTAAGVTLDGLPVATDERRVGADRYLSLAAAPAKGELKARLVARAP